MEFDVRNRTDVKVLNRYPRLGEEFDRDVCFIKLQNPSVAVVALRAVIGQGFDPSVEPLEEGTNILLGKYEVIPVPDLISRPEQRKTPEELQDEGFIFVNVE